jgi:cardiolipin-specific phospholipase
VNSIEEWRQKTGIENITLAGHIFGGYIGALYMLQHQKVVDRFILLSPVGTSSQQEI